MQQYIVIGNVAAHEGRVMAVDMDDIWSGENPSGWTYSGLCGPHGTILGAYETVEEADVHLAEWLRCDAPDTGRYCYAHNNSGR